MYNCTCLQILDASQQGIWPTPGVVFAILMLCPGGEVPCRHPFSTFLSDCCLYSAAIAWQDLGTSYLRIRTLRYLCALVPSIFEVRLASSNVLVTVSFSRNLITERCTIALQPQSGAPKRDGIRPCFYGTSYLLVIWYKGHSPFVMTRKYTTLLAGFVTSRDQWS